MTAGISGSGSSQGKQTRPKFSWVQATDGIQCELSVAEELQDLVLDRDDVGNFLWELSEYSSALASKDASLPLDCAVPLYRRRRALTGAGNTNRARSLNEIQGRIGQGPCPTALEDLRTVIVAETVTDSRWPEYAKALSEENIHSVLAGPLVLEQAAAASINFFSSAPNTFTPSLVAAAEQYAQQAKKALRLAVRSGATRQLAEDLQEAMESRTAIDLAVGVIMGQQRCSQDAACEVLSRAASARTRTCGSLPIKC